MSKNDISVIAVFFVCVTNLISCNLESEHNLGNGYYLLGSGKNSVISKSIPERSGVYNDLILGEIVDYDFDDRFIIILRNASDKAKIYFENQDSLWESQRSEDSIQYWIIDKTDNLVIGPLTEEQAVEERETLKISPHLEVRMVE